MSFDRDRWLKRYFPRLMRKLWRWYPPRQTVKKRSRGTGLGWFRCAECGSFATEVDVDHVAAVGRFDPKKIQSYVNRMLCPIENLRVVCKPCHKKKTAADRKAMRRVRK